MANYDISFGEAQIEPSGVSEEDYQKALRGVEMEKAKPGSLDIDRLETLAGIVREYRAKKPQVSGSNLSDKHQLPQDTTPRGVAPKLPEPPAFDPNNLDAMYGAAGADTAYQAAHFDQKLPNASKRKDLYVPPEYHPPPNKDDLAAADANISMLHPLDAARTISARLAGAKKALPTAVGGDVEHYYEPGIDMFREKMAPVLGPEVTKMNESSPQYREFSDLMWKDIYQRAEAAGTPVVRHKYQETPGGGDKIVHAGVTGAGAIGAAAQGFGEGAFLGIPNVAQHAVEGGTDNAHALGSAFPLAQDAGYVAGLINPLSIGAKIMSGSGKLAAKGIAKVLGEKEAATVAGKLTAGAVGGALGSGATSLGTDAVKDVSGEENLSGEDMAKRAALAAALGVPLGAAGTGLGMAAERLRKTTPLGQAEKLGARTSTLHGIKADPETIALRAEAEAKDVAPRELLASELEKPIADYAHGERARLVEQASQENAAAYRAHAGHEASYRPLLNTLTEAHAEMSRAGGGKVPFSEGHEMLRNQIAEMADVEVVPPGTRRSMSVDEARQRGFDVAKAMKAADIPEDMAGDVAISAQPRSVDAKSLDIAIRGVDELRDKGVLGKYHANQFQEAARQVRDEFGPEFAAIKDRHDAAFGDLERRLELSGISGKVREGPLEANQVEGLLGNVRHYDGSKSVPKAQALRSVAEGAGVSDKLERIRQIRALEDLEKRTKLSASLRLSGGELGPRAFISADPIRFRADPATRYLSRTLGTGGALAPRYGDKDRLPGGASQADIDQISRMLNMGSPIP